MTQPIDPQLGVPTTPNLDIPQIPYKKLPFPYQDLTDAPQPDNAQYYPDHIPGVVATVAAMHPTGTQAQDVHSNGNHAMLVDDVSGGSASTIEIKQWAITSSFNSRGRFEVIAHSSLPVITTLWGIHVTIWPQGAAIVSTTNDWGIFFAANGTTSPQFNMATGLITTDSSGNPVMPGDYTIHKQYPIGLELATLLNAAPGNYDLFMYINIDNCTFDIQIDYT